MAVSFSTDFNLTAVEIVEEARKKIGIHSAEEPLSANEKQSGLNSLNIMLKAWQIEGVSTHHITEGTHTLVQGDKDITFFTSGVGGDVTLEPVEMLDVRITRNGIDTQMTEISREEYYALPNKNTEGFPSLWFYDMGRGGGTLYIWPAPDANLGTLGFTYVDPIDDMDDNQHDLDLPQAWFEAVIYGLADRLSEEHGIINTPLGQRVTQRARETLEKIKAFDLGEAKNSIRISPSTRRRHLR